MIKVELLEFYITNVCNLTCRGCNRFNDGKFKGHQRWSDHSDLYEQWPQYITPEHIVLIGGEPTLNPDLELYVSNLRRLWPNSEITIQTNGTYTNVQKIDWWETYQVSFGVSIHDPSTEKTIKSDWNQIGPTIDAYVFNQPNLINKGTHWEPHNSDPDTAFKACDMATCHTMFNGKLYKCPMMAIMPEFAQQFKVRTTEKQQQLLDSFQPLTVDSTEQEREQWQANIDSHIPQCSLCKEEHVWSTALGPEKTNLPPPIYE